MAQPNFAEGVQRFGQLGYDASNALQVMGNDANVRQRATAQELGDLVGSIIPAPGCIYLWHMVARQPIQDLVDGHIGLSAVVIQGEHADLPSAGVTSLVSVSNARSRAELPHESPIFDNRLLLAGQGARRQTASSCAGGHGRCAIRAACDTDEVRRVHRVTVAAGVDIVWRCRRRLNLRCRNDRLGPPSFLPYGLVREHPIAACSFVGPFTEQFDKLALGLAVWTEANHRALRVRVASDVVMAWPACSRTPRRRRMSS
jgi:hypothetical protein